MWEVAVRQTFVIVKKDKCTSKDVASLLEKKLGDCVSVTWGHSGGSDPLLLLFLWAILTDNIELAKLFWEEGKVRLFRFCWIIHLLCVRACVHACVRACIYTYQRTYVCIVIQLYWRKRTMYKHLISNSPGAIFILCLK